MTIRTLSGRTPNSAPTKKASITSMIRTLDFNDESVNVQNYLLNIVHTGIVQRSSQSLKFIEIWQLKSTGVRSKESRQESQQRISYYDLFLVDYLFFFRRLFISRRLCAIFKKFTFSSNCFCDVKVQTAYVQNLYL